MANHYLFPQVFKPSLRKYFIGFDVENDGSIGGRKSFQYAHFYGIVPTNNHKKSPNERTTETIDIGFHNRDNAMSFLEKLGRRKPRPSLIGFNTSYDYPFFQEIMDDNQRTVVGGRFIKGKTKSGIKLYDCSNFVDGSLELWIQTLKMEETFGIKKYDLKETEKRCRDDARATYHLADYLETTFLENHIPMGCTIAGTALNFFKSNFQKTPFIRDSSFLNEIERNAYYGGRTEVFYRGECSVHEYDVNSMYVWIMANKNFPVPQYGKYYGTGNRFERHLFDEEFLTIADVTVNVPDDTFYGPLPFRSGLNEKLLFPRGKFRTWSTSVELLSALKYDQIEIEKVHKYVVYVRTAPFLKDYALYCWNRRKQAKAEGNKPLELMWKKLGNSLYGKFGQRIPEFDFFGKTEDFDIVIDNPEKYKPRIVYNEGIPMISYKSQEKVESEIAFPCIALFVSAYGRVCIYEAMKELEKNGYTTVYTDTDSLKVRGTENQRKSIEKCIHSGGDLGDFKYEGFSEHFQAFKPKFYKKDGVLTAKGVKKNSVVVETEDTVISTYSKPFRERESLRRKVNVNQWTEIKKVLNKWDDNKREWIGENSLAPLVFSEMGADK